ncbi:prevent-host-death protein [Sulfuricella denitrificans skB26]|uniref:Antitoxin n=1 Tax=Sulfuricella denitrificans (strain DSM 22764 / NBRC 105220 / skB26) TaxID=1163617 RepID=S6ANB2_SULDS|nr:type II toxin-antitoxin system prevent-host-death family antitoxin [Sulfuricella denitrificans]BAN36329.1 prevent-host-death protein [Sulfuricella denitrificans skB26]
MEALSYSELRSNLKKVMDRVCDTHEPVIVVRRNGEKTVMLSYADYSAIEETSYLMRSPKMAARLRESLESLHNGGGEERPLTDVGE